MRAGIFGVGILAMVMGITITTIYGLWYLCADLVYVILFPQLVSVVHLSQTNTYGSLAGYCIGMFFRVAGGEPLIYLPALIKFPGYYYNAWDDWGQRFPFRTLTMILSFLTIIGVSHLAKYLFEKNKLRRELDVFQCIVNIPEETVTLKEPFDRAPTPSPMAEMAILKGKPIKIAANGEINPALKFSKDDLLTTNGIDKRQISPMTSSSGSDDNFVTHDEIKNDKSPYEPQ